MPDPRFYDTKGPFSLAQLADIGGAVLAAGADPNHADDRGRTALSEAASGGHGRVVARMLAAGARRDAADADGLTALVHACRRGYANIVDMLVEGSAP